MSFITPPEAIVQLEEIHERIRSMFLPPLSILPSKWGEENIYLRKGTTPRPGPLVLEEFQREILDVFADPDVHDVVCVKPVQIGWSVILNIIAGYTIVVDPKPIMIVQPTSDNAKDYGRKRINPLIEDCPAIKAKIRVSKSRKGGNTLKLKEFPGGFLKLAGANTGTDLRSDPMPLVLLDERDGYPLDVNGEGEPGEIARGRTESFPDYKVMEGSTPAKPKGMSRLEQSWLKSDQRHFHVACPHCGHRQVLRWRDPVTQEYRLIYDLDPDSGEVVKDSVRYLCSNKATCGRGIEERYKRGMIKGGKWIADQPGRSIVGFHLNALYRPWKDSWAAMAQKWVDAQDDEELLKEFVTLQLAEFWEERGETSKPEALLARCEDYGAEVPEGVAVLVTSVDTQDNRLEANTWGFGPGAGKGVVGDEEGWLIRKDIFYGDPGSDPKVWQELEALRLREYTRADGGKMRASAMGIDIQGHHADAVYDYVRPRMRMGVFAIRGVDGNAKPVLVSKGNAGDHSMPLYHIATHAAKDSLLSRLRLQKKPDDVRHAKYLHFPTEWCDEEYFRQLTAEKKIKVRDKRTRREKIQWVKVHNRNEQMDLAVYALALLFILQTYVDQKAVFRSLEKLLEAHKGNARLRKPGVRVLSNGVS